MNDNISDVSIFIITEENQHIPPEEYDGRDDGRAVFIMLTNCRLDTDYGDDNSISIYINCADALKETIDRHFPEWVDLNTSSRNWRGYCSWQTEYRYLSSIREDSAPDESVDFYDRTTLFPYIEERLDGLRASRDIMTSVSSLGMDFSLEEYIPAVMLAYHTTVTFNGVTHHGFLPAIGQLRIIGKNAKKIGCLTKPLESGVNSASPYYGEPAGNWWSCTEYDRRNTWRLRGRNNFRPCAKEETFRVLPLFAI